MIESWLRVPRTDDMTPATRTKKRDAAKPDPKPREAAMPTPATTATRNRRQPALVALAVAFLALCGVGGWAAFSSASATVPVIGVRNTISRGEIIQRADLVTVQVGHDPALHTVPVSQAETVIGRRAATDLPAGSVVPASSITDALVPAKLHSIVGVFAKDGTAPATGITAGAAVRLIPLPATQQQQQTSGLPQPATSTAAGTVIAAAPAEDGTGTRIDVDVDTSDASGLQILAAQGRIALVIDSQER